MKRRQCFTLEQENNGFAHDLPFQLHGKAEQKRAPQRGRDTQSKPQTFFISFVQPFLMHFLKVM